MPENVAGEADDRIDRRAMLRRAAALAAGTVAAFALPGSVAEATTGDAVTIGSTVTASNTDVTKIVNAGDGSLDAAFVTPSGIGVLGESDTYTGVEGYGRSKTAIGVQAINDYGGPALFCNGPAKFKRSGPAYINAGKTSVTITIPATSLVAAPIPATALFLATLQRPAGSGVYVAYVQRVSTTKFKIVLNKKAAVKAKIAWFIMG